MTGPAADLDDRGSHIITGAYDGDGGIHLWVDSRHHAGDSFKGGVRRNDVRVVVGAEPGGRSPFQGKIQRVQILNWTDH